MEKHELNFADLVRIARKHIAVLVVAVLVGAALAFCFTKYLTEPKYCSVSKYLVDTASVAAEASSDSNLVEEQRNTVLSRLVVNTYIGILDTRDCADTMADILASQNKPLSRVYSGLELSKAIAYSYTEDSEFYTVTVTADTARDAYEIARTLEQQSEPYLISKKNNVEGTLKVIDSARIQPNPVNVHLSLNIIVGAFLAAAIVFLISVLRELYDVTVKDTALLTKALDLPLIGTIPECSQSAEKRKTQDGASV